MSPRRCLLPASCTRTCVNKKFPRKPGSGAPTCSNAPPLPGHACRDYRECRVFLPQRGRERIAMTEYSNQDGQPREDCPDPAVVGVVAYLEFLAQHPDSTRTLEKRLAQYA